MQRAQQRAEQAKVSLRGGWVKIVQNSSIRVLCLSYFLTGYVLYAFVFWLYTYLVDVRKFGIVGSGVFASLPFITAGILSPASGVVCDRLTARLGPRWGRRITAIVGPLIASVFLLTGAHTTHQYFAVAALSLSFGFQMSAESAVWSTAMDIGGRFTGLTTGIVNTANNLGGVISTALMPILVARFGWVPALDSCAGLAAVGALLWFAVKPDQRVGCDLIFYSSVKKGLTRFRDGIRSAPSRGIEFHRLTFVLCAVLWKSQSFRLAVVGHEFAAQLRIHREDSCG